MLLSQLVLAVRLVVQDPCAEAPWLDATAPVQIGESVGAATVKTLNQAQMAFTGDEAGIESIQGTVSGNRAIEVMSNTEMRAYGWCYSLNGIEPAVMPDQIFVGAGTDVVRWYFGFAHYKDGEWVSYCEPTHVVKPPYICH